MSANAGILRILNNGFDDVAPTSQPPGHVEARVLLRAFEHEWPMMEEKLTKLREFPEGDEASRNDPVRKDRDLLEELVETVRRLEARDQRSFGLSTALAEFVGLLRKRLWHERPDLRHDDWRVNFEGDDAVFKLMAADGEMARKSFPAVALLSENRDSMIDSVLRFTREMRPPADT